MLFRYPKTRATVDMEDQIAELRQGKNLCFNLIMDFSSPHSALVEKKYSHFFKKGNPLSKLEKTFIEGIGGKVVSTRRNFCYSKDERNAKQPSIDKSFSHSFIHVKTCFVFPFPLFLVVQ